MLRHTFLHIPGVGEATERKLWSAGLRTWYDFLASDRSPGMRAKVEESVARYEKEDWRYFDRLIPSAHKWRAHGDLGPRALFVDIETDGGAGGESITMIGAHDGRKYRSFVADENLDDAKEYIESHPLIVTFNGTLFDLPLIRDRFRYNFFNFVHIDLRFVLHRLGYKGGLKAIETKLGLDRSDETRGMGGWDAVRLWREHTRGSEEALRVLMKYNEEDVANLKPLLEFALSRLAPSLPSSR